MDATHLGLEGEERSKDDPQGSSLNPWRVRTGHLPRPDRNIKMSTG